MARRQPPRGPIPFRKKKQPLVLMGDVREAPITISEGGRTFNPVIALWVRADDGFVVGQRIDEPGHLAQTLVQALTEPMPYPGAPPPPELPSQVVLFNADLAEEVQRLLKPLGIEVVASPPFEPFDELFASLFAGLEQATEIEPTLDLPDEAARPLVAASERLWRAKPWDYVFDYPPFSLQPADETLRPLYASVLGASEGVFGIALYASLEDYEKTMALSMDAAALPGEDDSPEAIADAVTDLLEALNDRVFMLTFEPRDEVVPAYRQQMVQLGWPKRLGRVPTFAVMGGEDFPASVDAKDAIDIAVAVDAMVKFCQRHRDELAGDEFPITDTIDVELSGRTVSVRVDVSDEGVPSPFLIPWQ